MIEARHTGGAEGDRQTEGSERGGGEGGGETAVFICCLVLIW